MNQTISLIMTLALGLFIVLGALIVFLSKNNHKFVDFSLAFAFGVIIMLILSDLIPEARELFGEKEWLPFLIFTVLGFGLLKILDHFIPDHDEDEKDPTDDDSNLVHIGLVSSIALVLHNIIEGMAIYSTMNRSLSLGLMVCLGVGLHNIPLGMVITSTFYRSNQNKKKTMGIILGISLSTFLGGLILFLFGSKIINSFALGALLSITLGMLLYIAIMELLPKIMKSKNKKICVLGVILGIIVLVISCLLHE